MCLASAAILFALFLPVIYDDGNRSINNTDSSIMADHVIPTCGEQCVFGMALMNGREIEFSRIKEILGPACEGRHTIGQLQDALRAVGLKPIAAHISSGSINNVPKPFIAHVTTFFNSDAKWHQHFIVVVDLTNEYALVLDPPFAPYRIKRSSFDRIWTGDILTCVQSDSEQQVVEAALGSDEQIRLLKITLVIGLGALAFVLVGSQFFSFVAVIRRWAAKTLSSSSFAKYSSIYLLLIVSLIAAVLLLVRPTKPVLACDDIVSLGILPTNKTERTVQLRNLGSGQLVVSKVLSSCQCTVATVPDPISSGAKGEIRMSIDVSPGPGSADLLVFSNDPKGPRRIAVTWQGSGTQPLLSVDGISAHVSGTVFQRVIHVFAPTAEKNSLKLISADCGEGDGSVTIKDNGQTISQPWYPLSGDNATFQDQSLLVEVRPKSFGKMSTKCTIKVEYAGTIYSMPLPIDIEFSNAIRPENNKVVFSGRSISEIIGAHRTLQLIGVNFENSKNWHILRCPKWLDCKIENGDGSRPQLDLKPNKELAQTAVLNGKIELSAPALEGTNVAVDVSVLLTDVKE